MHKLLKASIAGAAGIALLAGGAGTFAAWQDSAEISVSSIQSGKLDIASASTGVWKRGTTTIDPSNYLVVPGDTLVFTQNLTVEASGTNLSATLSQTGLTASGDLANDVTTVLDVTASGAIVSKNTDGTWKVTPGTGASTLAVKVTVSFPKGTTGADNQAGQNEALNLSALKFTLAQTVA